MKRTTLALALIMTSFLTLGLAGTQMTGMVDSNPNMFKKERYCHITIQSPQNMTTLNTEPVFLNFTVKEAYMPNVYSYFYLLDGQDVQSGVRVKEIQLVKQETITNDTFFQYVEDTLRGQAVLPNLPDGDHNLTVFIGQAKDDGTINPANIDPFSFTTNFNVEITTTSPSPSTEPTDALPNSEPFSTIIIIVALIAAIAIVGLGLIAHFKKRKQVKFDWYE